MGLFNDVVPSKPIPCPQCGQTLTGWQTKSMECDGLPLENAMITLTMNERFTGEVHTFCRECWLWCDAEVKQGILAITQTNHLPPRAPEQGKDG